MSDADQSLRKLECMPACANDVDVIEGYIEGLQERIATLEADNAKLRSTVDDYKRLSRGLDRIISSHRMQFSPPNIGDIIDKVKAARASIAAREAGENNG